jgi:site-specific recombinase XerC
MMVRCRTCIRHGFATHLRNNKVDISVIKEALGREDETQTAVYLDDLDDKIVADEINRALNFYRKSVIIVGYRKNRPLAGGY